MSFLVLGKLSSEMERAFKNGVCFWVGVVDEVSFWFDNWVGVSVFGLIIGGCGSLVRVV